MDDEESPDNGSRRRSSELRLHICAGQQALRSIRICTSGAMLALGIGCGLLVVALGHWVEVVWQRTNAEEPRVTLLEHVLQMSNCACVYGRNVFLSLVPLADDIWLTRAVMMIDSVLLAVATFASWQDPRAINASCPSDWQLVAFWSCLILNSLFFICANSLAACRRTAARMQADMWDAISLWVLITVLANLAFGLIVALECHIFCSSWWWVPGGLITFYVVRRPQLRQALQEKLHQFFRVRTTQTSAAGIAGLVGDCSVKEALSQAKARFRCISLARLTQQDVADNRPDPSLFARTTPARLGQCDAFVSHSWHDDAAAKWAALQSWRSAFVASHSREPKVWLDKCCIDQNDIESDLRSLPVFLSGCSRLVMLCGTTYLSRLWCVLEIFTYVHVGGDVQEIDFVPVLRRGHEEEDMQEIQGAFESFDARGCTCFRPQDKEKMLAIVLAAFGGMPRFNRAVRSVMSTAGLHGGLAPGSEGPSSSSSESRSSSEEEEEAPLGNERGRRRQGAAVLRGS